MDWFVVDDITGIVRIAPSNLLEWDQESTSLTLSVLAVDGLAVNRDRTLDPLSRAYPISTNQQNRQLNGLNPIKLHGTLELHIAIQG